MTTSRILSRCGNVIAADFRPLEVTLTSETLLCDGRVMLIRTIASIDGTPAVVSHSLGDLATGHIVNQ